MIRALIRGWTKQMLCEGGVLVNGVRVVVVV
jgi:hypothetical protein